MNPNDNAGRNLAAGNIIASMTGVVRRKLAFGMWLVAFSIASFAAVEKVPPILAGSEPKILILTNAADILQLSREQAKAHLPVHISGMVTCYEPRSLLFVQDKTAGVFLYHTGDTLPVKAGQYVTVTGRTEAGLYSPFIDSPIIEPAESGPALNPQPVTLAQINLGGLDAQWVEFSAVLRSVRLIDDRLYLELADPPHRNSLWIPKGQLSDLTQMVGSLVRARGVVGIGTTNKHLAGFQMFASAPSDVTVIHSAGGNPFSMPLRLVKDLKTYSARNGFEGRVRVRGVVTLGWTSGRTVFIQDATGGLEVHTQEAVDSFAPGSLVDVVGYVVPNLEESLIEDAVVRKVSAQPAPNPERVSPEDLFHALHNRELVEVEAIFLGRADPSSNRVRLELQSGNQFLTALLDAPHPIGLVESLKPGSRLRVIGVSRAEVAPGGESLVTLLPRSTSDLSVISGAPTTGQFGFQVLAILAGLATLGLVIAMVLLQTQRRRTIHLLEMQTGLQAEMRQGEQQLRRSLEEREHMARDLHDDIIQSIYAVGLNLEDCRRLLRLSAEQAEQRLGAAIRMLNTTIRSVRGFIAGLEPKVLNGREFKTALKSIALTSGEGSAQFRIEVDPTRANLLTSDQATQLLHIAKEAMSNSLRHAHASDVSVSLCPVADGTRLEIRDDGEGFDPSKLDKPGHGLRNMAARARDLDGDLQIVSAPGQGCCIVVTVPQQNVHEPD